MKTQFTALSPDPRLAGKVAIVTGAGQVDGPGTGTGRATALLLAHHGASVGLVDVHPERAEVTAELIAEFGGRSVVIECDVTSRADCERAVGSVTASFGQLNILVNNVGMSLPGSVVDIPEDVWTAQIDLNLKSVYLMAKSAIPVMARDGGGSIVNVSSVGALRSIGFAAYSAAKGGMISLSKEMAAQHGPEGIRVNVVVPGSIQTPMGLIAGTRQGNSMDEAKRIAKAVLPLGSTAEGDGWDIGYATLFLVSDEARWISGQAIVVDGGATATTPPVALLRALGEMRSADPATPSDPSA